MKPNKSIDGLATRAAKKPIAPKTSTKKPAHTPRTITIQESPTKISKKPAPKPKQIKIEASGDNLPSPEDLASAFTATRESAIEDFLSPVKALDLEEEPKKTKKLKHSDKKSLKSKDDKTTMTKKSTSEKPSKKLKKKPSKARRIITSILLAIILILIALIIWVVLWGNDIIAKITGGRGNVLDLLTFIEDTYEPLKTDANGRTNILAFGTSGYNMQGDEGNGTHDGAQLTDSIMAISLNQETGDIAMISLPRDLKASPTCTATGKINEVFWCNNIRGDNEEAGAQALMAEVGSILNINFQYYAHLNWGSLISIVDTLGGIKVTLDEDIIDRWWTGAVYEAGIEYEINGEQALGLARARHGTAGGDFSRGASQQKILIGIKNRVFEKDLSLTDLVGLTSTLGDNLRTNLNLSEIKTAAHLSYEFDFESMRQISLYPDYMTTGNINNISYVLPRSGAGNYGKIQSFIAEKLSNDPRVYESSKILILNASETSGIAALEREKLTTAGYTNIDIADAPEGEYNSNTSLYSTNNPAPGTKLLLEKYYDLIFAPLPEHLSDFSGYNFIIILNPATDTKEE